MKQLVKQCCIECCDQQAFCNSSMCLDHIESGRLYVWNMIGSRQGEVISESEFVYVMRCGSKLKFGYTGTVQRRLKAIQSQIKNKNLTLSGHVNGSRRLEALVLAYVSPDRLHGEWFMDTPRTRFIEGLIASGSAQALWNGLRERAQLSFQE